MKPFWKSTNQELDYIFVDDWWSFQNGMEAHKTIYDKYLWNPQKQKRLFIYTLIIYKIITKKITTVKKVLIEKIYQTLETVSLAFQTPGIS